MFTSRFFVEIYKLVKAGMATKIRASKRTQIAYETDGPQDASTVAAGPSVNSHSSKKKTKSFEPGSWREVYKNIEQMRSQIVAPVDTMGCEKCHEG